MNDRSLYNPYISKLIEDIITRKYIVGGAVGMMLITGEDSLIDQYSWEVYVDTVDSAIGLADSICKQPNPHIDSRTVSLSSIVTGCEYILSVNNRGFVRIYVMNTYKDMDIFSVVPELYGVPNILRTFTQHSDRIRYLPKELALMDIYHKLYRIGPNLESVWGDALRDLALYENTKHGGGIPADKISKVVGDDDVLVGDYALNILGLIGQPTQLSFITTTHMSEITERTKNVILRKGEKLTRNQCIDIAYVVHHIPLPTDSLFKKFSIKCNTGKYSDNIADIYNATTYELVPYTIVKGKKIGSYWVLLRFIYIEMWILLVLSTRGGLSKRYHELQDQVNIINKVIASSGAKTLFPMDFEGVFHNENVIKKKLNAPEAYYPASAQP
jgi:hypothetical protein